MEAGDGGGGADAAVAAAALALVDLATRRPAPRSPLSATVTPIPARVLLAMRATPHIVVWPRRGAGGDERPGPGPGPTPAPASTEPTRTRAA